MKGGGTSGTLKDPHIYFSALQREDILNMMISTEDRVSYLLKCGFNEVDMKCAQVIERSVSC